MNAELGVVTLDYNSQFTIHNYRPDRFSKPVRSSRRQKQRISWKVTGTFSHFRPDRAQTQFDWRWGPSIICRSPIS